MIQEQMKDEDLNRLLPCPFCGGGAMFTVERTEGHQDFFGHSVMCGACDAGIGYVFACGDDPKPLLAEKWNKRAARPMEWFPIDNAPSEISGSDRDPETILVWVADGGPRGRGAVAFGCVYTSKNGGLRPVAHGYGGSVAWEITHWMPLPKPPKKHPGSC